MQYGTCRQTYEPNNRVLALWLLNEYELTDTTLLSYMCG